MDRSPATVTVEEVTALDGAQLFDSRCRAVLGVSGLEFIAARNTGDAVDLWGWRAVDEVEWYLPYASRALTPPHSTDAACQNP